VFEKLINSNGAKKTDTTYAEWKKQINRFGYGVPLGVDLPNEKSGNLPTTKFYNKIFGKNGWRSSSIISLAIGQGEVSATPLQLANTECIIANEGYFYKPHLIKAIGDKQVTKEEYTKRNYVGIDSGYFRPVINGMQAVVERGTGANSRIPGIIMCGKTGTAQVNGKKNNSVFVAFAPRDHPKIAIAVVVESSGQGAWWAAPIAAIMVEKYLKDSITVQPIGHNAQWFMDQNLLPVQAPKAGTQIILPKDSAKKIQTDSGNKPRVPKMPGKNSKPVMAAVLPKKKDGHE
jgi:penicillin-binding protein 2